MINLISLAIPLFFVLIGIEVVVARAMKLRAYRFDDAVVDLSCGIGQQVTTPFYVALIAIPYSWLFEHARLVSFPEDSLWPHVIAFLGVDFAYYWWHRWTHEMNLGWTTHVVHHQSEEYNLAVALRQSMTSSLSGWPFYLPLALLGVSPVVFLVHSALNTLYQFWIHTETLRKLGPLEWVLNTPSHHRVHHAINPGYLDRNYAGVLIIWDRMFGSFVEEREPPVYGTVKPLNSFDPLWANVHWAWVLVQDSFAARTVGDALAVWVRPPGWRPPGLEPFPPARPITRAEQHKYTPTGLPGVHPYVFVQFVPVAAATTGILRFEDQVPLSTLAVPAALVLWTTFVWGGLFEGRSWAPPLEIARLVAVGAAVTWFGAPLVWVTAAWGAAALSAGWILWLAARRGAA